jgi:hypothetical protein
VRILLLTAALATLLIGCGGGTPTSTTSASAPPQDAAKAAFAYARCMRRHGVQNFPDPQVHVSAGKVSVAIGINPGVSSSPSFKNAQRACQTILPGPKAVSPAEQHSRELKLLAFARCMRAHEVASFPDPTSSGQITQEMLAAAHVDVRTPHVSKAAYACIPSANGAVTAVQLAAAIAHGG